MNEIEYLQKAIDQATKIVYFTGAGVSTESGIKDFRSKDGIYNLYRKYGVSYEEILSHDFFFNHTDIFYEFYKESMVNLQAKPNPAHYYFASRNDKDVTIITQNIDDLFFKAGNKKVLELHGSILRNHCIKCNKFFSLDYIMSYPGNIPLCDNKKCHGIIKPDVVLYGEQLDYDTLEKSILALEQSDLLIVGGTSLKVYPAASLIDYFHGKEIIVINNEELDYIQYNHEIKITYIKGKIGEIFSKLK